jgi:hypothetical protein
MSAKIVLLDIPLGRGATTYMRRSLLQERLRHDILHVLRDSNNSEREQHLRGLSLTKIVRAH